MVKRIKFSRELRMKNMFIWDRTLRVTEGLRLNPNLDNMGSTIYFSVPLSAVLLSSLPDETCVVETGSI